MHQLLNSLPFYDQFYANAHIPNQGQKPLIHLGVFFLSNEQFYQPLLSYQPILIRHLYILNLYNGFYQCLKLLVHLFLQYVEFLIIRNGSFLDLLSQHFQWLKAKPILHYHDLLTLPEFRRIGYHHQDGHRLAEFFYLSIDQQVHLVEQTQYLIILQ